MKPLRLLPLTLAAIACQIPLTLLAQTPTPLIQFQFNESGSPATITNAGSIAATATYTGTLSLTAGPSPLLSDYCFNNSGATAMGSLGTTGGVYVNAPVGTSALKSMTLQGWFKSDTIINNGARLADNYNTTSVTGFTLRGPSSTENQGALYFLIDGQTVNSGVNTFNNTGAWIFFAVTYDSISKAVKFYKGTTTTSVAQVGSSQLFGIDVGTVGASTTNLFIGNVSSSNRPYDGMLDNIRIYGSTTTSTGALTQTQLENLRRADMVNAVATTTITVTANIAIRSDITPATFGAGVEYNNSLFRNAMNATGTTSAMRTMMSGMSIGSFRFPNGTTCQFYRWDNPAGSYLNGQPSSWVMSPDEIYTFTGTGFLPSERLFQVNTYRYWSGGVEQFLNQNGQSAPWILSTPNMNAAAAYAAGWVSSNLLKPSVTYWEIGNEDWIYWGATTYSKIFSAYATQMKNANPNIKLLAQTITNTFSSATGVNTPMWTSSFAGALTTTVSNYVYALSEHEYLNGYANTGAKDFSDRSSVWETQRNWQTQNMFAKIQRADRLAFLKSELTRLNLNWKIWMTEFNAQQYDVNGAQMKMQDLGHGLAIVDFTGRMLQAGVERIFFHSYDHNYFFSMIDYLHGGGTLSAPIKTVPGYGYEVFTKNFGSVMLANTITNNPQLTSPNEGTYNQVSVYSSLRFSDNTMRVIIVNRSSTNGIQLSLQSVNQALASAPTTYQFQELYSPNISDSNWTYLDHVKWSNPVSYPCSDSFMEGIVLKEHSAALLVIPLSN